MFTTHTHVVCPGVRVGWRIRWTRLQNTLQFFHCDALHYWLHNRVFIVFDDSAASADTRCGCGLQVHPRCWVWLVKYTHVAFPLRRELRSNRSLASKHWQPLTCKVIMRSGDQRKRESAASIGRY